MTRSGEAGSVSDSQRVRRTQRLYPLKLIVFNCGSRYDQKGGYGKSATSTSVCDTAAICTHMHLREQAEFNKVQT